MHPAFSIIFFTTAAGAGYGLLFLLGLMAPSGALPDSRGFAIVALALALGLVTAGLLASMVHLGRPERAWRALSQWRSSWLSREGVASVLTYMPALVLALSWGWLGSEGRVTLVAGALTAVGAVVTVICTGMIYASLKTIHQWHNAWVVPNYMAIGLMIGAVFLNALMHLWGGGSPEFDVAVTLIIAATILLKEGYWIFIETRPANSTPESATGLGRIGPTRFLESPHSEDNYLIKEMGFSLGRKHSTRLRTLSRVLGFGVPLVATALAALAPMVATPVTVLAALSIAIGMLIERWLFFAEAKHTVQLYYGAQRV
ncbi:MAG: dimethyl sulfoxide reductase anchor subunit [Alphaproteobacteria bacterium]|nr:dimethyl sulfoxide reductase anchor subunit [Alphaproteobacteria bacterium]